MKVLCLSFIILISIALVLGEKRCYSQKDCKEGECCTGGISPWVKGFCRKLSEEGEVCDPNPPATEKYFLRCPCVEGLQCVRNDDVLSRPSCQKE